MVLQSSSRIMAEFAVTAASPVVKMVEEKLASGLWEQLGLARSVHTDFEKLQSMLSRIKAAHKTPCSITAEPWKSILRFQRLSVGS